MTQSFEFRGWALMLAAVLAALLRTGSASGESCDVDRDLTKAIGIEEPWLENAGYVFTQVPDNGSPQSVTWASELEARFTNRLGMEFDLPAYTAQEPLGRAPGAFGPMAAGLKVAGMHRCELDGDRVTLLTGEIEGQYRVDTRRTVLPGQGNSVSGQAMWGELWSPWFDQGELGYTQRIGTGNTSGWYFDTSFGRALNSAWAAQLELAIDNQLRSTEGHRGIEGSVMPQISYRPGAKWRVALGEQASLLQGASQTGWSTWLMIEREYSDSDHPD